MGLCSEAPGRPCCIWTEESDTVREHCGGVSEKEGFRPCGLMHRFLPHRPSTDVKSFRCWANKDEKGACGKGKGKGTCKDLACLRNCQVFILGRGLCAEEGPNLLDVNRLPLAVASGRDREIGGHQAVTALSGPVVPELWRCARRSEGSDVWHTRDGGIWFQQRRPRHKELEGVSLRPQ